jgi:LPS-assembly lipoprotein
MPTRRSFLFAPALLALAGCGFRPLYGTESSVGAKVNLANVAVEQQQTRIGQLVRNELVQSMTGEGSLYVVKLRLSSKERLKSSLPGTLTARYEFVLNGQYDLMDGRNAKVISSGRSFSTVAYDIVRQPVADRQALDAASERAAIELANDIRLRVSVHLSKLGSTQ